MSDSQVTDEQNIPVLESAEAEEEQGSLDANAQALLYLVRVYTLHHRMAQADFGSLVSFVRANIPRFAGKFPQLEQFSKTTEGTVATYLRVLEGRGVCVLERSGEDIVAVDFPQFYTELVQKAFRDLSAHPDWPFPNEAQLGVNIPAQLVSDVNIKTDFVSTLGEMNADRPAILRLVFPELIDPIVVTSDLVDKRLLELAVLKLRQFVSLRNNAGYVTHRLNSVLRGHEHGLRDMINAVLAKPGRAVATLLEPSDFSFRFWAHFANLILLEYRERTDKLPEEHAYCQAAYLIGFYNVHYRGRQQQATTRDSLVKRFDSQFRKYPYAYTLKELYALRDERGLPLIRKNTKDVFTEFLQEKLRKDNVKGLPEIVQVKTLSNKDYYVRRELIIPLFVKLLHEKAQELRETYLTEWVQTLKQSRRVPAMTEEAEFARDLEMAIKNRYPFLNALLSYNLLFLARDATNLDYDMAQTMDRVIDGNSGVLYPLPKVLGIERKDLYESAKLRVPLFQRLALLKNLVYLFRRLFKGFRRSLREAAAQSESAGGKAEGATASAGRGGRPAAGPRPAAVAAGRGGAGAAAEGSTTLRPATASQLAAYNKAVQRLKAELLGKDKTIPGTLQELMERWNPLYDEQARAELVQDVNAMIRDYFRTLRRSFRVSPPTAARLRDLAAKLAENKSFARITKKDYFLRYIEIYMLKLLADR